MSKPQNCLLGDLIEFQRGYDLPKSKFVHGKYPVQSSNGILGYHHEYKVKAPSITIGRSGTVGIPHLIKTNFFPHNTALFVKDFKGNDVEYIYYLLKNLKLNEYKTGSGVPTMNRNHLHPLKIQAFLGIPTQKSIAHILSTLDQKIAINNQINAQLEQMAKTLYDYWFVQFDFPDENGKPYKSSGGKMVYNDTLKREIPKGWEVKSLGEVEPNIITGKTPSTQNEEFFNGNIPFITIGDIRNNMFIFQTEQKLSKTGAESQSSKYLPKDSLCVSCIATVGLIGFTTQKSQTNQQINSIIFKNKYNGPYFYFYLKDYFFVSKAKTGNTFANMNKGDFANIKMIYPSSNIIEKFFQNIVYSFQKIKNLQKQNQQLTQLRDFLLPMLMNGQVGVGDD
ncbi:restriction endonuclease subunit S [Moraxella nonliquefaciens]|uniref:Restriction endonuclease n=1 Tax=Moraxella nonliquefaciens TaxID=478 RepID=A0A1B8QN19_MORNO|nr:restriction endonuclease subunit S [Moraxella nonliquefaciens]OBX85463.1 restriction endonuclease [Moraxella nonliquefaciens]QPT44707.1 restriction endonuclease subunit S [Moraxella nonliquefaciens]QQC29727.1 restriction endonuclease subunit S [Moraxella nonliquefaciens]